MDEVQMSIIKYECCSSSEKQNTNVVDLTVG
jgi:hypothetical protein